ncbi:MAG: hypothetical protein ACYCZ2_18710, partial [Lutibacter sp.]
MKNKVFSIIKQFFIHGVGISFYSYFQFQLLIAKRMYVLLHLKCNYKSVYSILKGFEMKSKLQKGLKELQISLMLTNSIMFLQLFFVYHIMAKTI